MTPVFASRRRAEEFHSAVEATAAPRDARTGELLEVVATLRATPAPEPRPEFVLALREELMAAADTLLLPADAERLTLPPRSARRDRRLAAAIGGLAVVGATTSMAVASQSALPGEMLYPLKRAIEDAQTSVAGDRDVKALSLLDSATTRLDEVTALWREGDLADESGAVSASFVDFGDQASEAADLLLDEYAETGDADLVRQLRDFTASSMSTLEQLESLVPDSARDELLEAARIVSEIDARAERACPGCGGAGIDQIPRVLLAAGETTGSELVIVPGTQVEGSREGRGRSRGAGPGGTDPLSPPQVVTAPEGATGDGDGAATDDPLGGVTDILPDPTASNDDPVGEVGGEVEDGVKGTVEDTVKDTGDALDDVVDDLTDPLTGD